MDHSLPQRLSASTDELIYALDRVHRRSHLNSILDRWRDYPITNPPPIQAIALLLATDNNNVAVTYHQTGSSLKLIFARSRPTSDKELDYIAEVLHMVKTINPGRLFTPSSPLLKCALTACKFGVQKRLKKIKERLEAIGITLKTLDSGEYLALPIWLPAAVKGKSLYRAFNSVFEGEAKRVDEKLLLGRYFKKVFAAADQEFDLRKLAPLVVLGFKYGAVLASTPILDDSNIAYRLQRLGDYYAAVRMIAWALNRRYNKALRSNISLKQIPIEGFDKFSTTLKPTEIFNSIASKHWLNPVTVRSFKCPYNFSEEDDQPSSDDIQMSVHPECALASYMWNKIGESLKAYEIGVARSSCWLCEQYINCLLGIDPSAALTTRFKVDADPDKIQAGWVAPAAPSAIAYRIDVVIEARVREILQLKETYGPRIGTIIRRTRSQEQSYPMSTQTKSRWEDDTEDAAYLAEKKQEKERKKKAKLEKQSVLEQAKSRSIDKSTLSEPQPQPQETSERAFKRRKVANSPAETAPSNGASNLLRFIAPGWGPCRHIDNFEKLNHIEEGSYGWVSRARETATGEVVALKKLKMDNANDGFPVTGLREIQTLMMSEHANIVNLREVVMGDSHDE
ncbi:MAG: hypothetical protein M1829_003067 [Trizodia sp. TS-e1964]|nr:MAG: hypothetical protein M1829_003067 [Trizodia sp. TS-e1964]